MEFKMPEAKRERLNELLEYLGKTENYSEYYNGNRAEDFKKCFDVESEWCWKYADIVLRGLEKRPVGPGGEGHHGVPRSFYGVKHNCRRIDAGNWFTLSYSEHVWAHYCLAWCATGKMCGKMVRAFLTMYSIGICKKRPLMPSEVELLASIPKMEIKRIRTMEPKWAKVEAEGRTHRCEDPKQYDKEYREANREKIDKYQKAYREANREKIAERVKAYQEANKEKLAERRKSYYDANREKMLERKKAYREANKEKIAESKKSYYEANREKLGERRKSYYDANREKIIEYHKAYREANREKLAEKWKASYAANREKMHERDKARYAANREKILERDKARYNAKKAAGYLRRRNPVTGKNEWVFVGLPENSSAA